VGTELTNLVVVQGGNPTLTRFIPIGLDDMVRAVSEAADLSGEEAERRALDRRTRLGYDSGEDGEETERSEDEEAFDPALAYDVRRGLEEAVQTLAEDVQRSIEYHHSQPESREVSQVLVSGEGALVAGFENYLGELLGIAAHRGNPVGKLAANRSNVSDEQLGAMEPVLAVAFGLAMEEE
jgi:type IV pilus assembly protein PilM